MISLIFSLLIYVITVSAQSAEYSVDVKHLVSKNNYIPDKFDNCPTVTMGGWWLATLCNNDQIYIGDIQSWIDGRGEHALFWKG